MSDSSTPPPSGSQQTPNPQSQTGQTPTSSTQAPRSDRSSIIAVTALPVLVVIAGVLGFLSPDTFTPLAPTITWSLGVVMFFMGLTLTLPDFARIAKKPWIAALGAATQYIAMPLLGLLVVTLFGLPAEIAVGVILVGCAPGGTASNVVTYLAKGDTALSVSITTLSTLLAPVLTPLLTLWLAGSYMDVPFWSMFVSICQTVLVPVIVGVLVRVVASKLVDAIAPILPWLASIAIAYIVAIVVAGSADSIASAGLLVLLAVITHNVLGLGIGYGVAAACRLDTPTRRALSFEVGLQNSGLASTLATTYFSPLAALPGAVFSVWHNVSGALLASVYARRPYSTPPREQPGENSSSQEAAL
ncbi:MAG: bile acid:sodium symporter family protein [Brevibacterium sp.]|uniref:bile acid:sodium symporter family protein n=1 Tax=Brevibacterium sandarakinum TaxID=629680 RepID=UPI00265346BD|nr:bile acid:sodium symporter family protein [Brevibacterium sandarakinum]MDN5587649.1 bile acid:sodium symporter family protein [Brevibacterium sp.]MDN5659107.1 bile acid:sodium symporter family protein [Brevibacterium sandarakinum]